MYPLNYIEPVFRPPSEWKSLILQVTNGCSWNKCTFCDMYTQPQKKFTPRPIEEIENDLNRISNLGYPVSRIFLADGDAMTLSMRRLREIFDVIHKYFPNIKRISSYCLPRNIRNKTVEELSELNEMGLTLLYIGCETGDNKLLEIIEKGETFDSSLDALIKIKNTGIKSSVMILNGLGGITYSDQHAIESAKLMSKAQPEYLSTLVLSLPYGPEKFAKNFHGKWQPLNQIQLLKEMHLFMLNLNLDKTIFRSDHASNYLALKGVLGKDKESLLEIINSAIEDPDSAGLRQEWQRGL